MWETGGRAVVSSPDADERETEADVPSIARPSETGARMPIRIMIVDDHAVVRQGLRMFLGLDPELEVIGEAGDGVEAVAQAHALRPDVVLMDLLMPKMD